MQLIVHDVLQHNHLSREQKYHTPLEARFYRVMRHLEGFPCWLAVVAEGIDLYKGWMQYLLEHPEWTPICHGLRHVKHNRLTKDKCRAELSEAKQRIEDAFGVAVEHFLPPMYCKNRDTVAISRSLGMHYIRRPCFKASYFLRNPKRKPSVLDLHYWYPPDVHDVFSYLGKPTMDEPIFIVGAPRSGTTAYMRHLGQQHPERIMLKEIERIWKRPYAIHNYYEVCLSRAEGKTGVIDKNVRNSFRIKLIRKKFPRAAIHYIVRDPYAAISSWRDWACKTKKADKTVAGAARQWVRYTEAILLARKRHPANWVNVRYEDLCQSTEYFQSRNGKWQKRLTAEDQAVIRSIAGPLIRSLGY